MFVSATVSCAVLTKVYLVELNEARYRSPSRSCQRPLLLEFPERSAAHVSLRLNDPTAAKRYPARSVLGNSYYQTQSPCGVARLPPSADSASSRICQARRTPPCISGLQLLRP